MPVSKGRKKKKKSVKSAKSKAKVKPDEVYEQEGLRLERRGKMTYLQNTRTEEQHQAYLESLPVALENMDLSIKEGIEAIVDYFKALDTIGLLGGLAINHQDKQMDSDDDGMAETILEYGINIAAALPNDNKPLPEWRDISELITNLKQLRLVYNQRIIAESVHSRQLRHDENHLIDLRFHSMLEALAIRGNGYFAHVRELFLELFSGHDEFLQQHYGFRAIDIVNTERELEESFHARLGLSNNIPHPDSMMVFADWAHSKMRLPVMNDSNLADFIKDHPEFLVENGRIITYSPENVKEFEPLFRIRFTKPVQEKVVHALSSTFGDNAAYLLPPSNGHILAETVTKTHLFLRTEDDCFYQFALPLLSRNYLAIGQHLLENAPGDEKKYFKKYYQNNLYSGSRDRFLEAKVEKIFSSFLPGVRLIPNTAYPLPKQKATAKKIEYTELDLLGIGNYHTYLIEIKAGELSAAGKRGAIDSLVSRLKKNISEGDYQSNRAQNYIQDNSHPVFRNGAEEIAIDKAKPIVRIVVALDTFAGLLAGASVLENASLINAKNGYPWIINIYDLMVFSEILESEKDFADYLTLRLDLNRWKEFSTGDEINLLGHFLSDQLNFEHRHRNLDHFSLNNYLRDIDAYFYDRQRGLPGKKPKRAYN